jgi:putative ABC transport system substrate-binding protein
MPAAVIASVIALLLLGSLPRFASAQVPVVGWIGLTERAPVFEGFRQGLKNFGHEEGRTLILEFRWPAQGDKGQYPTLARELLNRRPAVIVSPCGAALRAIREVDRSVPVVAGCLEWKNFLGEVASYNRPGGRTTGYMWLSHESASKRLHLLKQFKPKLSRVAVLHTPDEDWSTNWQEMERVMPQLGVTLLKAPVGRVDELDAVIADVARQRAEALLVITDATTLAARERIAALAVRHRLLTAFDVRDFVVPGGLFSYGPDWPDMGRRVVVDYVNKILKGVNPGELPIQQPTRFDLTVNLRTARALKLNVPKSLLSQAGEVLE